MNELNIAIAQYLKQHNYSNALQSFLQDSGVDMSQPEAFDLTSLFSLIQQLQLQLQRYQIVNPLRPVSQALLRPTARPVERVRSVSHFVFYQSNGKLNVYSKIGKCYLECQSDIFEVVSSGDESFIVVVVKNMLEVRNTQLQVIRKLELMQNANRLQQCGNGQVLVQTGSDILHLDINTLQNQLLDFKGILYQNAILAQNQIYILDQINPSTSAHQIKFEQKPNTVFNNSHVFAQFNSVLKIYSQNGEFIKMMKTETNIQNATSDGDLILIVYENGLICCSNVNGTVVRKINVKKMILDSFICKEGLCLGCVDGVYWVDLE
ncbi:LIS1_homology motif [Hexamita inflata]|uniref:LIS1 homology motif n=1 Tax=Hexamita inflata TaxID=28002 RepID=A0AA86QA75_9EUKA|nr:LIS1 homology motif [Hexamita inflata]